jgi:hypothetical protein
VPVTAAGIGLPGFLERPRHGPTVFSQGPAAHDDALADRAAGFRAVPDQVIVDGIDVVVREGRPGDLRQRVPQLQRRKVPATGPVVVVGLSIGGLTASIRQPVAALVMADDPETGREHGMRASHSRRSVSSELRKLPRVRSKDRRPANASPPWSRQNFHAPSPLSRRCHNRISRKNAKCAAPHNVIIVHPGMKLRHVRVFRNSPRKQR